jgi:hypothetical protein
MPERTFLRVVRSDVIFPLFSFSLCFGNYLVNVCYASEQVFCWKRKAGVILFVSVSHAVLGEVDCKEIGDYVPGSGATSTDLCLPALDYLRRCSQVSEAHSQLQA